MAEVRVCAFCKKTKLKDAHHNRKYCKPCVTYMRSTVGCYPQLTKDQIKIIKKNAGKVYRNELAELAGISKSALGRYCFFEGLSAKRVTYSRELIARVIKYYEKHGKTKTEEKFPQVKLRSIIEHNPHKMRLERWKSDQIIEAVKMATMVPHDKQAKYFNRPRAYAGSIRSFWAKNVRCKPKYINGLSWSIAKDLVTPSCPAYALKFREQRSDSPKSDEFGRWIVLWVDVEKHLKASTPDHIRQAISAMAKFQRWLHGRNVRQSVKKILVERAQHEIITENRRPARSI